MMKSQTAADLSSRSNIKQEAPDLSSLLLPSEPKWRSGPANSQLAHATLPNRQLVWQEFRREQSKGTRVWSIQIDAEGTGFRIKQGNLGESLREMPLKIPGPRGREGSRTYMDAVDSCTREVERLTKLQLQKGFRRFSEGKEIQESSPAIDFGRPFPADLLTPKPRTTINQNDLQKMHDAGRLLYTRKYDGIGVTLVHHTYGWEAYTLSNNCVSDHFPAQMAALQQTHFAPGTILKGEAVLFRSEDPWREDFNLLNSRFGPTRNPETTRALIAKGELSEPAFVLYDILYHNGNDLHDMPYRHRKELWCHFPVAQGNRGALLSAEFIPDLTPENWMQRRLDMKIEGFVANDIDAVLGKGALSYSQAPARPNGIYKLKPDSEEDVVIFAVRKVDGEYQSVFTKQRYPEYYPGTDIPVPGAGQWFYCGRVSLHRSPAVIKEIDLLVRIGLIHSVPDNKTGESIPLDDSRGVTAVIEFFERQKGGKFRHAKFPEELRFRTVDSGDFKAPAQCFAQKLSPPE